MRDDTEKKPKGSWTKSFVRKWFNIKTKSEDLQPVYDLDYSGGDEGFSHRFSDREACRFRKSKIERKRNSERFRLGESNSGTKHSRFTSVDNYQIYVSTWNVAGKSPSSCLSLQEWLHTSQPADIYVLGFQEIVPLNAGNVLGTEDNGPARKWLSLIGSTLNSIPGNGCYCRSPSPLHVQVAELEADFEGFTRGGAARNFLRRSFHSVRADNDVSMSQPRLDRRFSVCDRVISGYRNADSSDDEYGDGPCGSPNTTHCSNMSSSRSSSLQHGDISLKNSRYCLVADKQMVGIFLTVWVRRDLRNDVRNLKVSCVGRGLMGYLGNKGSISVSMKLHQTSFCFVCSHLTSGQKEGDELRRNSDVMEILRKTKFPRVYGKGCDDSPQTILDHDRVIWLGDLNYRIALSYPCAKTLLEMRNWRALLEKDQLHVERRRGRVFQGWKEGRIYFPPTYKYSYNSDQYAGDAVQKKDKRRTPAWCDRILWYGQGLRQLSYTRGESRFSDHRPVSSIFLAKVESINGDLMRKSSGYLSSKIEVEELLPHPIKYMINHAFY